MKPVLIVEGKRHNVIGLDFFEGELFGASIIDDGVCKQYRDVKSQKMYIENQLLLDFDEALVWEGLHDKTITALEKRIEAYEEKALDISQDFISLYTNEDIPFPEVEAKKLQKEYRKLVERLKGLDEAKSIVFELEGGESNEKA